MVVVQLYQCVQYGILMMVFPTFVQAIWYVCIFLLVDKMCMMHIVL